MMQTRSILFVLSLLTLHSLGCASAQIGAQSAEADGVIWRAPSSPAPIGLQRARAGEETRVSLRKAALPLVQMIQSAEADSDSVAVSVLADDPSALAIAPAGDVVPGVHTITARVETADGAEHTVVFPVLVRRDPQVEFAYTPEGDPPSRVFVAGEFNGWNAGANQLEPGPDGVFRTTVSIPPGSWPYKFVVDGDWISDPANPVTDGGDYGNSLLVVEGEGLSEASLALLPPADEGRTLRLALPEGWPADAAPRLRFFLNNARIEPAVERTDRVLSVALQPHLDAAENHLTVVAAAPGRAASLETPWDFAGAARSPRDEVIYFTLTDRFLNGDPSNDWRTDNPEVHPLANYHGGDWAGIRQKIADGYFRDLGVTTLWISPANLNTFNVERDAQPPHRLFTSYHGYWPVSLTETNPAFGSAEELRALVDEANDGGIAVMLDFVANHVHDDHPLLQQHPEWITPLEAPDGAPNIRRFDDYPLTTWFDDFLPTLDYTQSPELTRIMVENAAYWLDETGADGFRFDAVKHVPTPFWRELTGMLDQRYRLARDQHVYTLGETISGRGPVKEYLGPDLLDGQFDFPLLFALQGAFRHPGGSMADLAASIESSRDEYPPASIMSPLLGNHDAARFLAYIDGDLLPGMNEKELGFANPPTVDRPGSHEELRAAFALLFALPGPPTLYYGDEIGMTGAGDPDCRRPMRWDDPGEEGERTRALVAQLAALRAESTALRRGRVEVLHRDEDSLLIARIAPEDVCLLLLARPGTDIAAQLPAGWPSDCELEVVAASDDGAAPKWANGAVRHSGDNLYWALLRPVLSEPIN